MIIKIKLRAVSSAEHLPPETLVSGPSYNMISLLTDYDVITML